MTLDSENLVPKVHPATREVLPDDPLMLNATPVAGDPEVMLRAIVREYAWMGWNVHEITGLFRDPFYPMLHGLWAVLGEDGVRTRIEDVFEREGVMRFRSTVYEAPEVEDPEVVQIGPRRPEGSRHVEGL